MFEDKTYEALLQEKLDLVNPKFDKREGSLIYDALAPNSAELAMAYIQMEWMFQQMFGDTAEREYLVKIAKDTRGIEPKEATYAVLKGEFNVPIKIGERFNLGTINYKVTELMDASKNTYKLTCETLGREGNKHLGTLIPINYIKGLTDCELTELLIPGEEEEDTEVFRKRWRDSFRSFAFGGNRDDYMEKIKSIPGVGSCKCYRTTNEAGEKVGGHVKCVITSSDYSVPSDEVIQSVQKMIDPTKDMEGLGLAPIGHTVHIQAVIGKRIRITSHITYETDITFDDIKSQIEAVVDHYFLTLTKAWETSTNLIVRTSQIEAAILNVEGVIDVTDTKLSYQYNPVIAPSLVFENSDISKVAVTKMIGKTIATKANESAEVSPDNPQIFTSAKNFTVKSTGKNILQNMYGLKSNTGTYTLDGSNITWVKNTDGTIMVTGTIGTGNIINIWYWGNYYTTFNESNVLFILPPGTYCVKDVSIFGHLDKTTFQSYHAASTDSPSFTITKPFYVTGIRHPREAIKAPISKQLKPQLELGTVSTEYEKYKESSFIYEGSLGALTEGSSVVSTIRYDIKEDVMKLIEPYKSVTLNGDTSENWIYTVHLLIPRDLISTSLL